MNIICNALVENPSNKLLVQKVGDFYYLPFSTELIEPTLRETISLKVLESSISDIPDYEYHIFHFYEDSNDGEYTAVVTFCGKTKKVRFSRDKIEEGYTFVSLSNLKDIVNQFENDFDKSVLRRYILRGMDSVNEYEE